MQKLSFVCLTRSPYYFAFAWFLTLDKISLITILSSFENSISMHNTISKLSLICGSIQVKGKLSPPPLALLIISLIIISNPTLNTIRSRLIIPKHPLHKSLPILIPPFPFSPSILNLAPILLMRSHIDTIITRQSLLKPSLVIESFVIY